MRANPKRVISFAVGDRRVPTPDRCLIIAEAGVNHNGDLRLARDIVDAAAESGADVVKFQTFSADRLASPTAPKAGYQRRGADDRESQHEMLRRLELPAEAHEEIQRRCAEKKVLFMSSPFDEESADLLERLNVPAFKVPSGELTNLPFLGHLARKGRPLIISTGMSTLEEVDSAVRQVLHTGNRAFALLHCVSSYPAPAAEVNLRAMRTLSDAFKVPVGYSDHTLGIEVALAAVSIGACILEKHFTLNRSLPGPDHAASLEPGEFAAMVRGIRSIESAFGDGRKTPSRSELETLQVARKSLVAASNLPRGTRLTSAMIAVRRPGTGLPPGELEHVLGRKLVRDVKEGEILGEEDLEVRKNSMRMRRRR